MGILWKQNLPISSVDISSDRIFAVQLPISNFSTLSIVGVYLPTTDSPIEVFKEYLQDLENVVNSLQADGPVLIMGDFNAHISSTMYSRGNKNSNTQGDLLSDMMVRTDHYAVSLCKPTVGPNFTFPVVEISLLWTTVSSTVGLLTLSLAVKYPVNTPSTYPTTSQSGLNSTANLIYWYHPIK